MPDRPSSRSLRTDDGASRAREDVVTPVAAAEERGATAPFASVGHEVLFEEAPACCDVCGVAVSPAGGRASGEASDARPDVSAEDAEDDTSYAIPGRSAFLVARGDAVHVDERPLCASCATALGVTALAEWDDGDDEG